MSSAFIAFMAVLVFMAFIGVGAFIGFASGALTVTEPVTPTLYAAADAYAGLDEDWITWLGDDV